MLISIDILPYEKKHVLRNMLEIYFHDMSEFDDEKDSLELNADGTYGYRYLDHYWTEEGRYPYILSVDGHLAGFSMIRTIEAEPVTFEVGEFCILRKYRKKGLGKALIDRMFSLHKGQWIINTPIKNIGAQSFWRNAVSQACTAGFEEYLVENGTRMEWAFKNTP